MIELIDICYKYENKQILKNINVRFDENITVITGPNGAGKSTLAKILMGIITPTSGKIIFNGKDITNLSVTERSKLGFSFAFQQPVKFKGLKVVDLLKIASKNDVSGLGKFLSSVGLCPKEYMQRELSSSLSGGELKRIEIATVLAKNSNINIFDEPEAGIDIWSFNNMVETFKNFHKSNKGTFVMISHQEKMINLADYILLLDKGEVQKYAPKNEILPKLSEFLLSCHKCGVKK